MSIEVNAAGVVVAMNLAECVYRHGDQITGHVLAAQLNATDPELRGELLVSATLSLATLAAGWMQAAGDAGVDVAERLTFARLALDASLPDDPEGGRGSDS